MLLESLLTILRLADESGELVLRYGRPSGGEPNPPPIWSIRFSARGRAVMATGPDLDGIVAAAKERLEEPWGSDAA